MTESPTKVGDTHFWVSDVFTIPCLSRQLHCAVVTPCRAGGLQNGVGPRGGADAAALRRRCRVLLQLQRLVARVHERHAPRMPAPLALQLVGVLQVVLAAPHNPDRRIALHCL